MVIIGSPLAQYSLGMMLWKGEVEFNGNDNAAESCNGMTDFSLPIAVVDPELVRAAKQRIHAVARGLFERSGAAGCTPALVSLSQMTSAGRSPECV